MTLRATLEPEGKRADKRSAPRKTLRLSASHRRAGRQAGAVLVHDLSTEGMLIETVAGLAVGEAVTIELPRSGAHEAAVVWSSGHFYGCRFKQPLPAGTMSAALLKAFPADKRGLHEPLSDPAPLSERLAALRGTRGWSMEQLGDRLGVSRQSVWYWESAQREPKPAMLARIAKLFGVSERELLRAPVPDESASGDLQQWKSRIADRFGIAPEKVRILIEL
jgi:transcriptional regulator with XRE-family HTH domain